MVTCSLTYTMRLARQAVVALLSTILNADHIIRKGPDDIVQSIISNAEAGT